MDKNEDKHHKSDFDVETRKTLERFLELLSGPSFKIIDTYKHRGTGLALVVDIILNLAIIIGLVVIIRTFLISPFQVYGPSMCDTFNYSNEHCQNSFGEYLIVNKFGYQNFFSWQVGLPKRGDVVVFHPPLNDSEFFIKRIIGLPGETLKIEDGHVFILNDEYPEGFQLYEPYLNDRNKNNTHPLIKDYTLFEIPEDRYFVMGDNRVQSSDSRICFKETQSGKCDQNSNSPYLSLDLIEGKAWLVLWPLNRISMLEAVPYAASL